ncbi:phage terminase small subunit P27 family [Mycobacterium attenuatum]|uniref:phage terminase small subunit P27 family n=1 Tax=Mycobacterium attenuatum TaxID=2341086 RepID=UPI000F03E667|nr:phage terminase small subunit P27 family [Mycobacterium attenuatum]VBA60287.1 hypothetical protein LAUMK41_03923 [Mycobacterium attenuatum]
MGGRGSGRIPAPAPLKLLHGSRPGRDSGGRKVPVPPKFDRAAPDAPEWLDDEGRAEWARVAPGLERLDLLKPEDRAALAVYCETWSRYVKAVQQYRAEGLVLTNPGSGRTHANPAAAIAHTAAAQMLRFAQEFGLTPASEARLASLPVDSGDVDDPFAAG